MSHIWLSHVAHLIESRHTSDWVMSHIWLSHVTHLIESCHTSDWVCATRTRVISHMYLSHVTLFNGTWQKRTRELDHRLRFEVEEMSLQMQWAVQVSYHTCVWVMSHICFSHVIHLIESCHTFMSHVTHLVQSWHTSDLVMSHVHESYYVFDPVMSHIWLSHVRQLVESCHTCNFRTCSRLMRISECVYDTCQTSIWIIPPICVSHVTHRP